MRPLQARFTILPAIALASTTTSVFIAPSAQAVQFSFGFSEGTPPEVIEGFNEAGDLWSSFLSDDVTVNLTVEYRSLASTSLGSFAPQRVSYAYRDILGALGQDVSSPNDALAFSVLPKSSEFDVLLDSTFDFDVFLNATSNNPNGVNSFVPYRDDDGDCNNRSVRITTANAKALGLPLTGSGSCRPSGTNQTVSSTDGTILLNSAINWDFDSSDGIDSMAYDFVGLASQGIGVMLGHISGVDVLDFNSPFIREGEQFFFRDDQFPFVSLPDLYRFSDESAAQGIIDWTTGRTDANGMDVEKYFSIDGGQTAIAQFSTGLTKGDGNRASGWKADELGGTYLGIAEPTPNAGQLLQFTENDQILFDAIGWNLTDPFSNPPSRAIREDTDSGGDSSSDGGNGDDSPNPINPTDPVSVPEPSLGIALIPLMWLSLTWLSRRRRR